MTTVRDHLWMWGQPAGSHDPDTRWKLPVASRMTPAEGAFYMGLPNLFMVASLKMPEPPWDQYALAFRPLKQIVWSIGLGHGLSYPNHVFPPAAKVPNITGLILDDLFTSKPDGQISALNDEELRGVQSRLQLPSRKLDLWAVVYEQDLDKPIAPMLQAMDLLGFFVWNVPNLPNLERDLARLFHPRSRMPPRHSHSHPTSVG